MEYKNINPKNQVAASSMINGVEYTEKQFGAEKCLMLSTKAIGKVARNATPAEWRAMSFLQRAETCTVVGFEVLGFRLYDIEITREDEDGNVEVSFVEFTSRLCPESLLVDTIVNEWDGPILTFTVHAAIVKRAGRVIKNDVVRNSIMLNPLPGAQLEAPWGFTGYQNAPLNRRQYYQSMGWDYITDSSESEEEEPSWERAGDYVHRTGEFADSILDLHQRYRDQHHSTMNRIGDELRDARDRGRAEGWLDGSITAVEETLEAVAASSYSTASAARIAGSDVTRVATKIEESVDILTPEIASTFKAFKSTLRTVDKVLAAGLDWLESLMSSSKMMSMISFVLDVYGGAYSFAGSFDVVRFVTRLMDLCGVGGAIISTLFGVFQDAFKSILEWFAPKTHIANTTRGRTEAYDPPGFLPLVSALMGTMMLGRVATKTEVDKVMTMTRAFNTAVPAMGHLESLGAYIVSYLPECVKGWLACLCPTDSMVRKLMNADFQTWLREVDLVLSTDAMKRMPYDVSIQKNIMLLHDRGLTYLEAMAKDDQQKDGKMYGLVSKYQDYLRKMRNSVQGVRGFAGSRPTPWCMQISGKPGIGKSEVSRYFESVLVPEGTPENGRVYVRNADVKHWDGYRGQVILKLDDAWQSRQGLDKVEMIGMHSTSDYPLDMASLEDPAIGIKGTLFTSRILLLLSNTEYPTGDPVITEGEALLRRRDLLFRMQPVPGARKPGTEDLDNEKRRHDWSHVEFIQLDPLVRGRELGRFTFEEALVRARESFLAHEEHEANMTDQFNANEVIQRARDTVDRQQKAFMPKAMPVTEQRRTEPLATAIDRGQAQGKNCVKEDGDGIPSTSKGRKDIDMGPPVIVFDEKTRAWINSKSFRERFEKMIALEQSEWLRANAAVRFVVVVAGLAASAAGIYFAWRMCRRSTSYTAESMSDRQKKARAVKKQSLKAESDMIENKRRVVEPLLCAENAIVKDIKQLEDEVKFIQESDSVSDEHVERVRDAVKKTMLTAESAITIVKGRTDLKMESLTVETRLDRLERQILEEPDVDRDTVKQFFEIVRNIKKRWKTAGETDMTNDEYLELVLETDKLYAAMDRLFSCDRFNALSWSRTLEELVPGKTVTIRTGGEAMTFAAEGVVNEIPKKKGVAEGTNDPNAMQIVRAVENNVFTIKRSGVMLCGVMIGGTVALLPRHFFQNGRGELISINTPMVAKFGQTGTTVDLMFDPRKIFVITKKDGTKKDAVLYDLGSRVQPFRKLSQLFLQEGDLDHLLNCCGELVTLMPDDDRTRTRFIPVAKLRTEPMEYTQSDDVDDEVFYNAKCLQYEGPSQVGSCGSPFVLYDPRCVRKIVGIHVAGVPDKNYGVTEIVTSEDLLEGLATFARPVFPPMIPEGFARAVDRGFANANMTVIGDVAPKDAPRMPTKTRIRPSPLHNRVRKVTKAPAALTPWDPLLTVQGESLITKGFLKYKEWSGPLKVDTHESVLQHQSELTRAQLTGPRFIATEEEAINGKPSLDFCDAMNMSTSPGYPYVIRKVKGRGKRYLFDGEIGHLSVADPELRERLDMMLECAKKGLRVFNVSTANLKDELRPIVKVQQGKTRVFINAPVHVTILFRRYFLAYVADMFRRNMETENAPGMNVDSYQWTKLMMDFMQISKSGFAGDYQNWDGKVKAEVMMGHLRIINEWYAGTEEEEMVRTVLMNEMVHTFVLCGRRLYMKHQGVPSGFFLTTPTNCAGNAQMLRYGWLELAPMSLKHLAFFEKYVCFKVFGDDNKVAVDERMQWFYNMVTIGKKFAESGVVYTSADKESDWIEIQPNEDTTFLKRSFRKSGNQWMPALEKDSIHELINWTTDSGDPWLLCLENCSNALSFAYSWGEEFFTRLRTDILAAAAELGKYLPIPDYSWYSNMWNVHNGMVSIAYEPLGDMRVYVEEPSGKYMVDRGRCESATTGEIVEATDPQVSVEAVQGVTIAAQSEPIAVMRDGAVFKTKEMMDTMSDQKWTISTIVEKPVLLPVLKWTTTQSVNAVLGSYSVPWDLVSNTSVTHEPFSLFAFTRLEAELTATVSGSKFHNGLLIIYHVPVTSKASIPLRWGRSRTMQSSVSHVLLNPAVSTTAILKIPFINQKRHINLRAPGPFDHLGTVVISVFNQLRAGEGASASVNVSVSVSFKNAIFSVPLPRTVTSTEERHLEAKVEELERQLRMTRMAMRNGAELAERADIIAENIDSNVMKMVVSELKKTATDRGRAEGNFITSNYNMDHSAIGTIGSNKQTDELSADLSIPMADKPNCALGPPPVLRHPMGYMSNAQNVEFLERLTMLPGQLYMAKKDDFSSSRDEMELNYLTGMMNFSETIEWTTTIPSGQLLWAAPVCPLPNALKGVWREGMQYLDLTTLDYISAKADVWNGSLRYALQIVASSFHTGRLMMSVHYGSDTVPSNFNLAMSEMVGFVELNAEKHEFTFVVPFMTPRRTLRVPHGPPEPLVSTGDNGERFQDFSSGWIALWVVNELVTPAGTPSSAAINIWRGGGPDYTLNGWNINNASLEFMSFVTPVTLGTDRGRAEAMVDKDIILAVANESKKIYGFDETTDSINELLMRYYPVLDVPISNISSFSQLAQEDPYMVLDIGRLLQPMFVNTPTPPSNVSQYRGSNGLMSWFMAGFRGYRGGVNFKIQFTSGWKSGPYSSYSNTASAIAPDVAAMSSVYGDTEGPLIVGFVPYSMGNTATSATRVAAMVNLRSIYRGAFWQNVSTGMAVTTSDPGANYCLIQVPCHTPYQFLTPALTSAENVEGGNYHSQGTLIIIPPRLNVGNNAATSTGVSTRFVYPNGRIKIWMAAADEFRMGIYLGPPPLELATNTIGMDTYRSTAASVEAEEDALPLVPFWIGQNGTK